MNCGHLISLLTHLFEFSSGIPEVDMRLGSGAFCNASRMVMTSLHEFAPKVIVVVQRCELVRSV